MPVTKSSLFVVSALGAGMLIGFFAGQPTSTLSENPLCPPSEEQVGACSEKLDDLRGKFQALTENDIQEYIRLKDMKAKYEKADEIFGKMLNIFLLDLGLRISSDRLNELKAAAEHAQASAPSRKRQPEAGETLDERALAQRAASPAAPTIKIVSDRELARVSSEDEAKKLLENAALADPVDSWRNASPTSKKHFQMINGSYTGELTFFEDDSKPFDVTIDLINVTLEGGELKGQMSMLLEKRAGDSRSHSTTGPNSKIRNFKSGADGSILIETMGGNGMIQLYYFPQLQQFQGNYYGKKGLEPLKREGLVVLTKR